MTRRPWWRPVIRARPRPATGCRRPRWRARTLAGAFLAAGLWLSGCSLPVDVTAGPDGRSAECTALVATRPQSVLGQPSRSTTGEPGTAAWGEPAIVLRCGSEPVGPTTLECVAVDGIDWVVLAQGDDGAVFATYGRRPAVEVEVPAVYAPETFALTDLAGVVGRLPQERSCS